MRIDDGGGSSVSIPPPPPPAPPQRQASPPVFQNHSPVYGPFVPHQSGNPGNLVVFSPPPPPPPPHKSDAELIREAEAAIAHRASSYTPSTPKLTVNDEVARAVQPVMAQAQRQHDTAHAALSNDRSAAEQTKARLDALYNDMDRRGPRASTLQSAQTLQTQLSHQQQQVVSDQHRLDAADANASAAGVVAYSQQGRADAQAAVASSKTATAAHDALGKSLPPGATPKSGQTLSSAEIAGLDAHQKAAYQTYVSALTRADADQARVQSDLAAVNLNAARLQNYASDPRYGTIATDAVSAVNARLRPQNLALSAPASIAPAAARAQLSAAERTAIYRNAVRDATEAHAAALTNPQVLAAQRKVDAIKAQIDAAEKTQCLANDAPLMQQYKAATVALQQAASPIAGDLAIKDGYANKLKAAANVQDRQALFDKAQAEFDRWKTAHHGVEDSDNPHSGAVNAAAGSLSHARQLETALNTNFEAAIGRADALQQANEIAPQLEGARDQYAAAENALSKLPAAPANVYAGRGGAYYSPTASANAKERKSLEQAAADAKSLYHRWADPAAAAQAIVAKLSATADQQMADYGYSTGLAGQASPAEVAALHDQQLAATHEVERADFVLKLDPTLRAPLTAADQQTLADKQADFDRLHLFQSGERIDGNQALATLKDDQSREDKLVNSRGWLQSTADLFNSDPSRLQDYIDKRVDAVTAENAKHDAGQVSDTQYQADLHSILADYGADTQTMNASERKDDSHWQTAEQVTDFALAAVAGLATGGAAGAVLAFGVYQTMQGVSDTVVASKGGDMRADGQLSLAAWAGGGFQGSDFKMAAITAVDDAINSATLPVAAAAGAKAVEAVAGRGLMGLGRAGASALEGAAPAAEGVDLAGTAATPSLTARIGSQAVSGTVNQAVTGAGQILTTMVDLGAAGQLGTKAGNAQLRDAFKTQTLYLAAAPVIGAAVHGIARGRAGSTSLPTGSDTLPTVEVLDPGTRSTVTARVFPRHLDDVKGSLPRNGVLGANWFGNANGMVRAAEQGPAGEALMRGAKAPRFVLVAAGDGNYYVMRIVAGGAAAPGRGVGARLLGLGTSVANGGRKAASAIGGGLRKAGQNVRKTGKASVDNWWAKAKTNGTKWKQREFEKRSSLYLDPQLSSRTARVVDRAKDGIKTGEERVIKGNARIKQGNDSIKQGNDRIKEGNERIKKGEQSAAQAAALPDTDPQFALLTKDAARLTSEGDNLRAEGNKLKAAGAKLRAAGAKLKRQGEKLTRPDGKGKADKLKAKGDKLIQSDRFRAQERWFNDNNITSAARTAASRTAKGIKITAKAVALTNLAGAAVGGFYYFGMQEKRTNSNLNTQNAFSELAKLQASPDAYMKENYTNKVLGLVSLGDHLLNIDNGHLLAMKNSDGSTYFFRRVPEDLYNNLKAAQAAKGVQSGKIFVSETVTNAMTGKPQTVRVEIRPPYRMEPGRDAHLTVQHEKGNRFGFGLRVNGAVGPIEGDRPNFAIELTFNHRYDVPTASTLRYGLPSSTQGAGVGVRQQNTTIWSDLRLGMGAIDYNKAGVQDLTDPSGIPGNGSEIQVANMRAYIDSGNRDRVRLDGSLNGGLKSSYVQARETLFFEPGLGADFFKLTKPDGSYYSVNGYYEFQLYAPDARATVNPFKSGGRGTGSGLMVIPPLPEIDPALQFTTNDPRIPRIVPNNPATDAGHPWQAR